MLLRPLYNLIMLLPQLSNLITLLPPSFTQNLITPLTFPTLTLNLPPQPDPISSQQVDEIMKDIDFDNDGYLSFTEFSKCIALFQGK